MQDTQENTKVGKFKPKRKFLNFVSSVGNRTRLISNYSFIKGDKLSGMLDGSKFKFTIYEDTVDIEEIDTSISNDDMIKRLISDIDEMSVVGYVDKFIIKDLEFENEKGDIFYLEVVHQKPFDKLKSFFDDVDELKISDKASSFLDSLFSDSKSHNNETSTQEEVTEVSTQEINSTEIENKSFLEDSFIKMNEEKVMELSERIENIEININKYKRDIAHSENLIDTDLLKLDTLKKRLESFNIKEKPNGYVFHVSHANQSERILTDVEKALVSDIANVLKADEKKLINILSNSMYLIKISHVNDFENKKLTKDIYNQLTSIDINGVFNINQEDNIEYIGKLTWHQIVDKLMKTGFEQNIEFEKLSGSNSYKNEDEINLGGVVLKSESGFVDMGNGIIGIPPSNENKHDFKQKYIRTFTEPTDLVIIGSDNDGYRDIELTDDYFSFQLRVNGDVVENLESEGFLTILTIPEYKQWYSTQLSLGELDGDDDKDSIFIQNYVGSIGIGLQDDEEGYITDFDETSYIYHQDRFEEYPDFFINLNGDVRYQVLEGHDLNKVVSYVRDNRITDILEKK